MTRNPYDVDELDLTSHYQAFVCFHLAVCITPTVATQATTPSSITFTVSITIVVLINTIATGGIIGIWDWGVVV